ncbi:TUSC1 protein, partial [Syrrhaptes paradoxus]|nr:TUSC1 protein [Syrrhaptes paradoxus]
RWAVSGSARGPRVRLAAADSGCRGGAEEFTVLGRGREDWRGQSRGSLPQLVERYADLAARHWEALRMREEQEWYNAQLSVENTQLRLENHHLRQANRYLRRGGPDKSAFPDAGEEVEALRAQLRQLKEKHRRALLQLRRCRAAGGPEASKLDEAELDELLKEDEQLLEEDEHPLSH